MPISVQNPTLKVNYFLEAKSSNARLESVHEDKWYFLLSVLLTHSYKSLRAVLLFQFWLCAMGIQVNGRPRVPVVIRSRERVEHIEDDFFAPTDIQSPEETAEPMPALQDLGVPDPSAEEQRHSPAQHYHWLPMADVPATQDHWNRTEEASIEESNWLPPEEDWCSPALPQSGACSSQQSQRSSSEEENYFPENIAHHQRQETSRQGRWFGRDEEAWSPYRSQGSNMENHICQRLLGPAVASSSQSSRSNLLGTGSPEVTENPAADCSCTERSALVGTDEGQAPQIGRSRPEEESSFLDQWHPENEGFSTRNRRTPPNGNPSPPTKRSRLDGTTGAEKWCPSKPLVTEQERFEIFDSFVRFPPTFEEGTCIQWEQALRKRLNLTILSVEIEEDQEDDLFLFRPNVTRELEEYGLDFNDGQEILDSDNSFSDTSESVESPERFSELLRLRWMQAQRDRTELNQSQTTPADVASISSSEVGECSESDSMDVPVPPSAGMQQHDSSRSVPVALPLPKRVRLSYGAANLISGASSAEGPSTGSLIASPGSGFVPADQTGEEPPSLGIQRCYSDHIHADASLPLTFQNFSHPDVGRGVATTALAERKASFGWRNFIMIEHPSSPSGTRPPCEPDTPPTDRASDADDDELVDVGGIAGDGHQENGASALVDSDATSYSSASVDFDIWHTRSRGPGRGRRLCRPVFLQLAAVISWLAMFICVLAGNYIASIVLFMLFLILVTVIACKKFVLPVCRDLWRGSSAASEGVQDATVVQPPLRMLDLAEMYPWNCLSADGQFLQIATYIHFTSYGYTHLWPMRCR